MNPETELQAILDTMDIPELRRTDMGWLKRNLAFRNRLHPKFQRALELILLLSNVAVGTDGTMYFDPAQTYHDAGEYEHAMNLLDEKGVPSHDEHDGETYSIWGRILYFKEMK